jgi:hypothetical protein
MAALPAMHIVNRRGFKFEKKIWKNLTEGICGKLAATGTTLTGKK